MPETLLRLMTQNSATIIPEEFEDVIRSGPFPMRFPRVTQIDQDEEWCEVKVEGVWRRIRFHDYSDVYEIPGLYETIFYRTLRCNSPLRVANALSETLLELGESSEDLRVLDFGAGNGMAGEALHSLGTRKIIGFDILEKAKMAAIRDRPWVYEDYFAADITSLDAGLEAKLREYHFNTLFIVAALGYGDIPPKAFFRAFDFIEVGGNIAINIKEDFLTDTNSQSFARHINDLVAHKVIQVQSWKRYRHRLSISGKPLFYVALIAKKVAEIPRAWR